MKNKTEELIGVTTSFFVAVFMIILTRWNTYEEVMNNYLFITLLIFMICVVFGVGIPKLFKMKKKKDKFIMER